METETAELKPRSLITETRKVMDFLADMTDIVHGFFKEDGIEYCGGGDPGELSTELQRLPTTNITVGIFPWGMQKQSDISVFLSRNSPWQKPGKSQISEIK